RIADVTVLISGWGAPVLDGALLDRASRLRAVFHAAGSVAAIITDAAWDRGITVTSAYAANAIPVAEYTVSMILLSLKRVWAAVRGAGRLPPRTRDDDPPGCFESRIG